MYKLGITFFTIICGCLLISLPHNKSNLSVVLNQTLNINPPKPERSDINQFLDEWFNLQELYNADPKQFFSHVNNKFTKVLDDFQQGLLTSWENNPNGCLSLIILSSHANQLFNLDTDSQVQYQQLTKHLRQLAISNQYDKLMPTEMHLNFLLKVNS